MLVDVALLGATVVDTRVVVIAAVVVAVVVVDDGVVVMVCKSSVEDTSDSGSLSFCCDVVVGFSYACVMAILGPFSFIKLGEIKWKWRK